jgi:hypothetical protein
MRSVDQKYIVIGSKIRNKRIFNEKMYIFSVSQSEVWRINSHNIPYYSL